MIATTLRDFLGSLTSRWISLRQKRVSEILSGVVILPTALVTFDREFAKSPVMSKVPLVLPGR